MLVNSTNSWHDLKNHYFDNLNELHGAITKVTDSSLELTRIYSEILKKSKDSSPETVRQFIQSWIKKIDTDNIEQLSLIKDEYEKLQYDPSKMVDLGSKIQQKLHRESISKLDAYDGVMRAFYDTWKETWPDK